MSGRPDNAGRTQGRDAGGRWRRGVSGNPAGLPRGTRHRATRAVEALLDGEAEALTRKVVELALDGDTTALRLCLERLLPPAVAPGAGDLAATLAALVEVVAAGELTPGEAGEVAKLVEAQRRAVETAELEQRLAALEAELKARPGRGDR